MPPRQHRESLSIGASALAAAGTAAAYPQGEIFLANLESHGIDVGSPDQAFKAARAVCDQFADVLPG